LKEKFLFKEFDTVNECEVDFVPFKRAKIKIKNEVVPLNELFNDDKYKFLFSVEEVNKLVLSGVPFRDAYRAVGAAIDAGNFSTDKQLNHQHIGSIGNLSNERIRSAFDAAYNDFGFEKPKRAIEELTS